LKEECEGLAGILNETPISKVFEKFAKHMNPRQACNLHQLSLKLSQTETSPQPSFSVTNISQFSLSPFDQQFPISPSQKPSPKSINSYHQKKLLSRQNYSL
jgi:hypothetical protein